MRIEGAMEVADLLEMLISSLLLSPSYSDDGLWNR